MFSRFCLPQGSPAKVGMTDPLNALNIGFVEANNQTVDVVTSASDYVPIHTTVSNNAVKFLVKKCGCESVSFWFRVFFH